jgi:hypothetical protein
MSRQVEAGAVPSKALPDTKTSNAIAYGLAPRVFKRNLVIALIVGSLPTVANQFDVIVRRSISTGLLVKICVNFAIPFVVSSVSAYANRCGP